MRFFAPFIGSCLAAAALVACGGGGEGSSVADKLSLKMSPAEIARLPEVRVSPLHGPPPHELVVHDLRKGSGATMKRGDTILINWAEVPYSQAFKAISGLPVRQLEFSFGKYIEGWEKGLPGMKVGGRRELIVPPRLGDTGTTTVYVVDLLGIKPG